MGNFREKQEKNKRQNNNRESHCQMNARFVYLDFSLRPVHVYYDIIGDI